MTMLPGGLMCIQTPTALSLFNGATCEIYRHDLLEIPYSEYSGVSNVVYDEIENVLWCSSLNQIWIFNLATRKFEYNIFSRLAEYGLPKLDIQNVFILSSGELWVVSTDGNLWICDRTKRQFRVKRLPQEMNGPISLLEDGQKVWMLSLDGILAQFDRSTDEIQSSWILENILSIGASSRFEMDVMQDGCLWLMFDKALFHFDPFKNELIDADFISLSDDDLFTSIALDGNDNLWIGTARFGLSIYFRNGAALKQFPYLEMTNGKRIYPHTDISRIYADHQGGMWVATQTEGLAYWNRTIIKLENINSGTLSSGKMPDEGVKCLLEDEDGSILLGTIKGLLRFDPKTNAVNIPYPELSTELCISLYKDSHSRVWLGTFYNGVYCIVGGKVRHFRYPEMGSVDVSYQEASPNYNCVRDLFEDSNGQFWISVYGGVGRFQPDDGTISLVRDSDPRLGRFMLVRDVRQISDSIAAACGDNGSYFFSIADGDEIPDLFAEEGHEICNQIHVDKRGFVWMAGGDGLKVYDNFGMKRLLTTKSIMSLAEDSLGNIWAASFSNIFRVMVSETTEKEGYFFSLTTYGQADGVDSGVFFQNSSLVHSNGKIYFGGSGGACVVDPNSMHLENYDISPYISSFQVNGEEWAISPGQNIVLNYDETAITIAFTNLNYANPSLSFYKYKLEPLDKDWQMINSEALGQARYTYLPPGEYIFKVMAAYNGTDWSSVPTQFSVTVRPPFFKSRVAFFLYILILLMILSSLILFASRREKKKMEERNREDQLRHQAELNQMKFRFFTNISHELRTPLSLILLPLDSLIKEEKEKSRLLKLETMRTNAAGLLSLVNHLLDFRRIEMGGEKLQLCKGDIGEFIESAVLPFQDAMTKKGIVLEYENALLSPIMAFDSAKMQKIVNNLLSNAMKFTPSGGYVSVRVHNTTEGKMCMEISDTGIGIKNEDIDKIFDRFYRSETAELEPGTGIGLSIVKQYVEMHQGSVSFSSEVGKGTTFIVVIPSDLLIGNEATVTEERPDSVSIDSHVEKTTVDSGNKKIMVVDDNEEFRLYLSEELSKTYQVSMAEDGKICLERLLHFQPDVVICDVMMPTMDGFEVTKSIKSNINTSHIPVILLTARASDDFRLEGYETGADAYLTKPFKMEILEARIKNLIEERQKRISTFSQQAEVSPMHVTISTIDQKLMTKIMESVEKNMDNTEYSVEILASDVGMHRMNLYRKIHSLVNMTPLEFIRTMRLKRAAQIIGSDPNLSVNEVSMMVGFNTVKYFSKYFKEKFGVNPSQYSISSAGKKG
ncbi:MAG: ATP-binding protein [Candidatus Cryptobacteroides sp.]|jgi:signal transduction histidine kinase/DNA-binding response OmpR family regulator/ligand-binding sensor domain-containing protein